MRSHLRTSILTNVQDIFHTKANLASRNTEFARENTKSEGSCKYPIVSTNCRPQARPDSRLSILSHEDLEVVVLFALGLIK